MPGRPVRSTTIVIRPPNFQGVELLLIGESPYVQHRFGEKARQELHDRHATGKAATSTRNRQPKDFFALYEAAKHVSTQGWCGIPAPALRNAMISACRVTDAVMTKAKLAIFVEADGLDREDSTPLVRIYEGEPHYAEHYVHNETGVADLRARPMWDPGWKARVRIRYDADMFTAESVANLLARAGQQVGVGEGRPDSRKSNGMGWGLFRVAGKEEA